MEKFVAHTNPLNVLKGDALMTPVTALEQQADGVVVAPNVSLQLDEGVLTSVQNGSGELATAVWDESTDIESVPEGVVMRVPVDITMREAVEIRHQTHQFMVAERDGRCMGVIDDQAIYHALLGRHFSRSDSDSPN